ncbi:MAG: hypothetical protein FD180_2746 [Planctomycetota bacterium]|nr:MAG: hypothetical protein FD180_2746 [Planctomycetota bacterium]
MKVAALLITAVAAALLVAAVAQAASLSKRLHSVPAPAAGAASDGAPHEMPPSPFEVAEMAKRIEACAAKIDLKIERESRALREAKERFAGIKGLTDESLEAIAKESLALKEELAKKKADKEKVAELTKRIRTEQQKAMFKRFMGDRMKGEMEKVKAELELTPDQAVQFDKVSGEMFDKFAEMGSSFMDGETNPAKFAELVTESNSRMQGFMSEDQFKKYQDIQKKQWGGGGGGRQGSGDGQPGGGGQ